MERFIRKPVVVEAIQNTSENREQLREAFDGRLVHQSMTEAGALYELATVNIIGSNIRADLGDWIVIDENGIIESYTASEFERLFDYYIK